MFLRNAVRVFVPALLVCAPWAMAGQQKSAVCGAPPVVAADSQPNIFSEQQEEWLGDAVAEMIEADFRIMHDPASNAYLQAIVDRLAATLPDTHIHFRVQIIDSPVVNGFSIAGGRIYLTRKLVAQAKSDDEVASVLGHEMGHIASHQFAFETTRDLKKLMGVTSVGDRADIFVKFRQLEEARMRSHTRNSADEDDKQEEADHIGVYVTAAAGYRPQASAEFWNRMFFTNGKSGGTFSDFFGMTKPSERRLGKIQKLIATIPPGCGGTQEVRAAGFAAWHERVVEDRTAEAAHMDGTKEISLSPPLRMDLDRLRFSPDGTKLLAQDESTIFVMSVDPSKPDPLQVDFKLSAEDALAARFSPDSKRVVFTTQGLHTEEWSVEQEKLLQAHEPLAKYNCVQVKLSPDGRTIACMVWDPDSYWMDLSLLDSDTGQVLWQKKDFFQPNRFFMWAMVLTDESQAAGDLVPSSFSADGNYLLIGPDDHKVAFDLRTRTQVKIGGALVHKVTGAYAFLGNDRVAGVSRFDIKDSGIFSFPDGRMLKKAELPVITMQGVSAMDGSSYVLTDGFKDYEVSLTNVDTGKVVLGSETAALDVWGGMLATENRDGRIWIGKLKADKFEGLGTVQPPESELAELYSVALSPDGRYLAVSTRTRGGLWNLETGHRMMLLRGFHAVWNGDDLLMEFSKKDKQDAMLLDASMKTMHAKQTSYAIGGMHVSYGMLTEWKDAGKHAQELVVHRMSDGTELWRRTFPDGQPYYTQSHGWKDMLFSFRLNTSYAKTQVKADKALESEAAAVKKKDDGRLIEAVDAATGKVVANVVVELSRAYSGTDGLNRVGDLLYATTADNRTQVFSLKDGHELREVFGRVWAEDAETGRVCINNREDEAIVYDGDGKELAHLHVGSPLRFASFVDNGQKILLLGADQEVRIVNVAAAQPAMSVASAK